jgi:cation diffusion facilitator family transporter
MSFFFEMSFRNENLSVTLWGLVLNVLLGLMKCIAGILFHSRALIADGLHSFLDLSTDCAVLYGLKMASKPKDADHPYGHHKFASLANLFIALILSFFCLLLIFSGILSLQSPVSQIPGWPAFWVALISLLVKEVLFFWTLKVARKHHSRLLLVNAWHHRLDSISSLVVVLVIPAVHLLGEDWVSLDSIASIVLGSFLLVEGLKLLIRACKDLLDTAPESAIINDLREHILPTPGAMAYHNFRARRVGDMIEVDLHLQVDPGLAVEKGHDIAKQVRNNILRRHPEVVDVLIHIEPATDPHLKAQGVFEFEKKLGTEDSRGN